jgi:exodeoxyribonuclease VII small subunit
MSRKAQAAPRSFEEATRELEAIVAEIERGEIGLEESLARYERGVFLIQYCRGVLAGAEKRIEVLAKDPSGQLKAAPMESE